MRESEQKALIFGLQDNSWWIIETQVIQIPPAVMLISHFFNLPPK